MSLNDRDEHCRFAEGNAGGPGRPPRRIERDYLRALAGVVDLDAWQEIVQRAVDDARNGDAKARAWLSRHLLPTPSANEQVLKKIVADERAGIDPIELDASASRDLLQILRSLG